MPLRLESVTFSAQDAMRLAHFWAELLGRRVVESPQGAQVPGEESQLNLGFVVGGAEKSRPNRMHIHLTSDTLDHQQHTVATALRLGGRHLDVGQRPEEEHIVLADPEDNEFCVIERGNDYLAGCGFLGELACDGTRAVGHFWSEALGWPLVWDQDEETAIQSPRGGTKIAWGGPPVAPVEEETRRQHFVLVAKGDLAAEVDRLIVLGATRAGSSPGESCLLADPDGAVFCVRGG